GRGAAIGAVDHDGRGGRDREGGGANREVERHRSEDFPVVAAEEAQAGGNGVEGKRDSRRLCPARQSRNTTDAFTSTAGAGGARRLPWLQNARKVGRDGPGAVVRGRQGGQRPDDGRRRG